MGFPVREKGEMGALPRSPRAARPAPMRRAPAFLMMLLLAGCLPLPRSSPLPPIRRFRVDYSPTPSLPRLLQADLVIVQPVLPASDLEALAAAGVRAIAYLSIGEAEADDPAPPTLPPACILGTNPHWGSHYVDPRCPEWQTLVISRAQALRHAGYAGLLLDTVDTAVLFPETAPAMAALICRIRTEAGGFLVQNRGFPLLRESAACIDAVLYEDLSARYDFETGQYVYEEQDPRPVLPYRDRLTLLALDYVPRDQPERARRACARARSLGFLGYIAYDVYLHEDGAFCDEVLSSSPCPGLFRIGLGEDPERLLNGYDPEAPPVREALRPDVAVAWLNGYRDPATGRVQGDLSYFRDWAARGRFAEWGARGYELMIITWENYDGQNPAYGPPTFGDYHISEAFVQDVAELSTMLADHPRTVYFVLATEFSTYPACRYDRSCADPLRYSDRYNAVTREYYDQLIPRLREAMAAIRARAPWAQVGIGFGGWLATFDENTPGEKAGRSLIRLFDPLIRESDWVFFQSMIGRQAAENGGLGNPDQIRMNVEFFAPYGKPIGLAHYNPGLPYAERLDVMREDLLRMLDPHWRAEMRARGLRLFAFMRYGPMKYNGYGVLDLAAGFADRFRETGGCVFLPLVAR